MGKKGIRKPKPTESHSANVESLDDSPAVEVAEKKPNKSQMIRDFTAQNPDTTAKECAEALTKMGTPVNEGLVGNVRAAWKKKGGATPGKRGRKPGSTNKTPGAAPSASDGSGKGSRVATFLDAVAGLGGVQEARSILDAIAKLKG